MLVMLSFRRLRTGEAGQLLRRHSQEQRHRLGLDVKLVGDDRRVGTVVGQTKGEGVRLGEEFEGLLPVHRGRLRRQQLAPPP